MRKVIFTRTIFKLLFFGLLFSNFNALAQKTTIWIVRHAEKNQSGDTDPGLTDDGQQRAKDLVKALKHENIKAIYITSDKRSALTANPLVQKNKILPCVYNGDDLKKFASTVFKNFQGKNVLIVGHADTVMPLIQAFGATPPFEGLDDEDYDMLFSVTLKGDNKADLSIMYYGNTHHTNDIPQKYILENFNPGYTPPVFH